VRLQNVAIVEGGMTEWCALPPPSAVGATRGDAFDGWVDSARLCSPRRFKQGREVEGEGYITIPFFGVSVSVVHHPQPRLTAEVAVLPLVLTVELTHCGG
jgi:hypothetical protein